MKRVMIAFLAAAIICILTACQVTPEAPIVVQKDTERMVEQAADDSRGTKVSKLKVPDGHYTFSISAADGRLTVNVDAPVTVPESEKIPTVKVSETGFTQEQVTGFFNYLFPDEKPVTGTNVPRVMTKDDIQELIVAYKQYIAEGTTMDYAMLTEEETEEEIKNLEKQYEYAPETAPELDTQVSDGTMTTELTGGDKYAGEEILRLDAQTEAKHITVCVPLGENGNWENYIIFSRHEPNCQGQFSEMNAMSVDETNWQAVTEGKLTITYEDAKALCDGFFDAGHITDVALSDVVVIDDERIDHGDGRSNEPENYAYKFQYVRIVGDSPVASMPRMGSGDEHALPWIYENIMFWVNDSGILYIDWCSHTTTGEIINDDTGVIDFEEAHGIFETMIVTKYGASTEWSEGLANVSIDIDGISLSLVRVREQNASGRNGVYTPAWVFYGNIKQEIKYDGYEFVQYGWDLSSQYPFAKYPVLIINAIDGSIIDPSKGY